jgi:hypothetical protein
MEIEKKLKLKYMKELKNICRARCWWLIPIILAT